MDFTNLNLSLKVAEEKDYLWYEHNQRFVIIEKFEVFQLEKKTNYYYCFLNKNDQPHRNNDNPCYNNGGTMFWSKSGKYHRKNGRPARIRHVGAHTITDVFTGNPGLYNNSNSPEKEYYINGERHRDGDLPAVVFASSKPHLYWFENNKLHRNNGKPAIINGNFLHYYKEGQLYYSEIKYDKKWINWIMKNPFKLSTIFFIVISIFMFIFGS